MPPTTRRTFAALAILLAVLSLAWSGTAFAHAEVDEGRRLFEEAQFLEALDAFARAEAAEDLSLDELVTLLETRALVHLAMGNEEPMRSDLARLVAVAPDHALDRRAPPEVRRAYAEVRSQSAGPVRLSVSPTPVATGVSIEATAENDPQRLVRRVRVFGRATGDARWERADDAPLLVTAEGVVEYYARAVGPGGVVLASSGSDDAPLRTSGSAEEAPGGGGDDTALIAILVVVGVLVVAGGVTTGVILGTSGGSDQTQLQPFTVRF